MIDDTGLGPAYDGLRRARPDEVASLLYFWGHAAEGKSISDDEEGVRRLLERDPDAVIVAELGGEIVGTVIAGWDGWRCHLYRLAVTPAHRRKGIAGALIAAAENRFTELGGRRGDAMVLNSNAAAHQAWQAGGYSPEPHWTRWVKHLRPS